MVPDRPPGRTRTPSSRLAINPPRVIQATDRFIVSSLFVFVFGFAPRQAPTERWLHKEVFICYLLVHRETSDSLHALLLSYERKPRPANLQSCCTLPAGAPPKVREYHVASRTDQ